MFRPRSAIPLVALLLAVGGCDGDSTAPLAPHAGGEPRLAISDAQYDAGVEGFYFLPPMVPAPDYSGTFDGTRTPVADICVLDATRTACSGTIVKTFNGGSASEAITVNEGGESYNAVWTRAALNLSTGNNPTFYRLTVSDGATVLGYADLWVVNKQSDLKNMPAGFVGVVRNRSFQIKFRIEEGAGGPANQAPVAEDDSYGTDAGVPLSVAAAPAGLLANDDLGSPEAVLDAFGGGSLGGSVADNAAGSTVAFGAGSLTVNADGSFDFTPDEGFSGYFTFEYRITNAEGSSTATVTIAVVASPVAPEANDDGPEADSEPGDDFHTGLNTTLNITAPGLLANDALGTPAAALVSFGGGDLGGLVTANAAGATVNFGTSGSLTVNADGSLSYTPVAGFTGYFTFDYRIENAAGSSDATVTIAVGQRAVAVDDSYPFTLVGNVPINTATSSGFSVLANDTHAGATVALVSASNGTATLDLATGTFAFVPAPGHEGPAGFTYSLTNGFGTVSADVSLTVSGMIWFIDNTADAGNGALGSPFNSVAAFTSANDGVGNNPAGGDHVFIYESAASYAGPLVLLNGQKVIGQDATSSLSALSGLTPPADSPPLPVTNSGNALLVNIVSAGNGITLAQNNAIHGLRVGNSTGTGIAGASVGTLAVSDVTVNTTGAALSLATGTLSATFDAVSSSGGTSNVSLTGLGGTVGLGAGALSGSSGVAFAVTGGNATVSYAGTISNAANRVVSINGRTGGALTLSGSITDTGAGIVVQNNTGGTIAFTGSSKSLTTGGVNALNLSANTGAAVNFTGGGLAITTTTGAGFTATGGGTVQVTGANNVIASGTGVALNVQNTTIGGTGLTFRSISANGAANGIVLNNTGILGGLQVTGNGTTHGSGGAIVNTVGADGAVAGNGIYLSNTRNVSLSWMNLSNHANHAIRGLEVTNFDMDRVRITGTNGNNVSEREGSVSFENLYGSSSITRSYIEGGAADNVQVQNGFPIAASATLNRLTLNNDTIGHNGATGNAGVNVAGFGSAVMNVTIQNSRFTGSRNNNISYVINEDALGDVLIQNNVLSNDHPQNAISGFGIYVAHASNGAVTYQVSGNSVSGADGSGIEVDRGAGGTAPMTGSITNNAVGTTGVANSGSKKGSGIFVGIVGTGSTATHTTTVSNNTVRQFTNFGIYLYNSGTGDNYLNATVQNNNIAEPSPNSVTQVFPTSGFRILNGTASGHDGRLCLVLTGNTVFHTATSISHEVRVWGRFGTRTGIPGLTGDPSAYLASLNTITPAAGSLGAVNATSTLPFQSNCPPT
jgi:hypothetical protein